MVNYIRCCRAAARTSEGRDVCRDTVDSLAQNVRVTCAGWSRDIPRYHSIRVLQRCQLTILSVLEVLEPTHHPRESFFRERHRHERIRLSVR
jgi:hypothetical protein